MVGAINLLSVPGQASGIAPARAGAPEAGFQPLFSAAIGAAGKVSAPPVSDPREAMLGQLGVLRERALANAAPGQNLGQNLGQTADSGHEVESGLVKTLASLVAGFDQQAGLGLIPALRAGLPPQTAGGGSIAGTPPEKPGRVTDDGPAAMNDALQALVAVIGFVERTVQVLPLRALVLPGVQPAGGGMPKGQGGAGDAGPVTPKSARPTLAGTMPGAAGILRALASRAALIGSGSVIGSVTTGDVTDGLAPGKNLVGAASAGVGRPTGAVIAAPLVGTGFVPVIAADGAGHSVREAAGNPPISAESVIRGAGLSITAPAASTAILSQEVQSAAMVPVQTRPGLSRGVGTPVLPVLRAPVSAGRASVAAPASVTAPTVPPVVPAVILSEEASGVGKVAVPVQTRPGLSRGVGPVAPPVLRAPVPAGSAGVTAPASVTARTVPPVVSAVILSEEASGVGKVPVPVRTRPGLSRGVGPVAPPVLRAPVPAGRAGVAVTAPTAPPVVSAVALSEEAPGKGKVPVPPGRAGVAPVARSPKAGTVGARVSPAAITDPRLVPLSAGLPAGSDMAPALLGQVMAQATKLLETGRERGAELAWGRPPEVGPLSGADFLIRALPDANRLGLERASNATAPDRSRFAGVIAAQIRSADVREGRTVIELSPRGLGQVEVDIRTEADGTLKVTVRAENTAVLNTLRDARDLFAQSIGAAGGGVLDFQEGAPGQDKGRQGAAPIPGMIGDDDVAATAAKPESRSEVIGGGQLDIMT